MRQERLPVTGTEPVARVKIDYVDSFDIAAFDTQTHLAGKKARSLEPRTYDKPRCWGRRAIRVSNG